MIISRTEIDLKIWLCFFFCCSEWGPMSVAYNYDPQLWEIS